MSNTLEYILRLRDQLTTPLANAAKASQSAGTKISGTLDKITSVGTRMKKTADDVWKGSRVMTASINELKDKLNEVNKVRFGTVLVSEFKEATRQAKNLEQQIGRLEGKGKGSTNPAGSVLGMFKGAIAVGTATAVAKESVSAAMDYAGNKRIINFSTGGRAAELMLHEKEESNRLGLDYKSTIDGMQRVMASMRGSGIGLKQQMNIFEGFQTAGAALNLTPDKMHGILYDVGEMVSSGIVNAKEMRRQMAVYLPGALRIAADAMGVTEEKFNHMMRKGQIMATDFLPKFSKQLKKEFGEAAVDAADNAQAGLNRFNNAIYLSKVWLGDKLVPAISEFWNETAKMFDVGTTHSQMLLAEQGSVQTMIGLITRLNEGNSYRSILLKQLVKDYPTLFQGLDIEHVKNSELLKTLNDINDAYNKRVKLAVNDEVISNAQNKYNEAKKKFIDYSQFEELSKRTDPAGVSAYKERVGWWDRYRKWERKNFFTQEIMLAKLRMEGWQETINQETSAKSANERTYTISDAFKLAHDSAALKKNFGKNIKARDKFLKLYNHNSSAPDYIQNLQAAMAPVTSGTPGMKVNADGELTEATGRAGNINSGGQRSIVINIAKQVGVEQVHVMNGQQVLHEIEGAVKEVMRRTLQSVNGTATSN